jgi:hypothetical protein
MHAADKPIHHLQTAQDVPAPLPAGGRLAAGDNGALTREAMAGSPQQPWRLMRQRETPRQHVC